MPEYELDRIITRRGGLDNFAIFMSIGKKREKIKDYIYYKYIQGKIDDIFK